MAFSVMANGASDAQESDFWKSKAEGILASMREYVRTKAGSVTNTRPEDTNEKGDDDSIQLAGDDVHDSAQDSSQGTDSQPPPERCIIPPEVVELHSFPVGRNPASGLTSREGLPDNLWVAEHVGLPLCEAMTAYRGVSRSNGYSVRVVVFRACSYGRIYPCCYMPVLPLCPQTWLMGVQAIRNVVEFQAKADGMCGTGENERVRSLLPTFAYLLLRITTPKFKVCVCDRSQRWNFCFN